MTHFSDLGLSETLLRALTREGYETPSAIQAQAIPHLQQGRDLLGIAQTGTGKTAAFALPILDRILADRRRTTLGKTRVLVLAPTRELAAQIAESFRTYSHFFKPALSIGVILGGVSYGPQYEMLNRGVEVLVATPGRLLEHLGTGRLKLDATEVLVLDEADHMLDLGFIVPIRRIVAHLPKTRQTLLFSATMPKEIAHLAGDLLKDPIEVAAAPVASTVERVEQRVFFIESGAKRDLLVELLSDAGATRAIVFTRTKRGADRVAAHLEASGINSHAIHGNKSQNQRVRALEGFRRGAVRVLVATDIAARGIDVDGVTHVVNYELPDVAEAYVHRIGRTARAGAAGIAISLCDGGERPLLKQIERLIRRALPAVDRRGTVKISELARSAPAREAEAPEGRRRPHGVRPDRPRHLAAAPAAGRTHAAAPPRAAEGEKHRTARPAYNGPRRNNRAGAAQRAT